MNRAVRPPPISRLDLALGDGTVSYLSAGDSGPCVVFNHATGFNAATYGFLIERLASACRVLAPDHRGHGLSCLPADPAHFKDWRLYADDLVRFLDAVAPPGDNIVLAGHSMGASVSLLAAARRPERVKGLILADPVIMPPPAVLRLLKTLGLLHRHNLSLAEGARRRKAVWPDKDAIFQSYNGRSVFRSFSERMLRDYIDGGTRTAADGSIVLTCDPEWEATTFERPAPTVLSALRRIHVPVRVFRGARGSTCPPPMPWLLAALGAEVQTVPGTSHFLVMEQPDVIAQAILALAHDG